jgi:hypothetical protein
MRKWNDFELADYLRDERSDCYYFWFRGKITRKMDRLTEQVYEQSLAGKCEWNGIRHMNAFNTVFGIFVIKYTMGGKWNGQSKAEYDKNYKRISDIVAKSDDIEKQEKLARAQANKIVDEWKAINRAMAAKEMGHEHLFEVFFQRAYELGSVTKQEYREYQMQKLGI